MIIINTILSTIAAYFFSVLFNVRKSNLIYAAIGGGLGYFTYAILSLTFLSHNSSLFIASCTFSVYSQVMARMRKTTDTTFAIAALIPLVPGKGMYLTMLSIVNNENQIALITGLQTITDAALLAMGIVFVATIFKLKKN